METTLATNGTYTIDNFPTRDAAIVLSGDFASGTVTISIKQGATGTAAVIDSATAAYAEGVSVGVGNTLTLTLAGATPPSDLLVQVIPLRTD